MYVDCFLVKIKYMTEHNVPAQLYADIGNPKIVGPKALHPLPEVFSICSKSASTDCSYKALFFTQNEGSGATPYCINNWYTATEHANNNPVIETIKKMLNISGLFLKNIATHKTMHIPANKHRCIKHNVHGVYVPNN